MINSKLNQTKQLVLLITKRKCLEGNIVFSDSWKTGLRYIETSSSPTTNESTRK